jgi:hypothetical protein
MSLPGQFHFGGRTLGGRYQLKARVTDGHEGVLYRGHDEKSGAPVAVRLVWSESLMPGALMSFSHPRVERVLDIGQEDGQAYVVREWLDGAFLYDELDVNPLGAARILSLMSAVCEGVAALHAAGRTHGRLDTRKVFVGRPGSPLELAGESVKLAGALDVRDSDDVAACVTLYKVLIQDGAPEPLRSIAVAKWTSAAELGAACEACLAGLTAEQMNHVGTRAPRPAPPPITGPMPTNWSPPPPRPKFEYLSIARVTNPGLAAQPPKAPEKPRVFVAIAALLAALGALAWWWLR